MATRLKVVCNSKHQYGEKGDNIILSPVTSGSEENKSFFAATPGGVMQFYCLNEEAAAQFTVGKSYCVDIFESAE